LGNLDAIMVIVTPTYPASTNAANIFLII
jgi:hypothetical protein